MSIVDRARAHAEPDKIRRIEVPEWGDPNDRDEAGQPRPLIVYYRMVTLDDMALVNELDGSSWHKQAARIVVLKATDEKGEKLFRMTDATTLREQASPDVVNRVALAIIGRMSLEDAAKN